MRPRPMRRRLHLQQRTSERNREMRYDRNKRRADQNAGALESEVTATAIFSSESDEMITKLEKAVDDSEKVEIWEVNLDKPGETENAGKFAAKYFQGYVTESGLHRVRKIMQKLL